jgi:hypothetical protein
MDEHEAVNYVEAQFLERESDLVAIPHKAFTTAARSSSPHNSAAVWFPLTLVLPLMAFAIVPSLLGRVVVIMVIVGAELKLVTSTPELKCFLSTQEWNAAASV